MQHLPIFAWAGCTSSNCSSHVFQFSSVGGARTRPRGKASVRFSMVYNYKCEDASPQAVPTILANSGCNVSHHHRTSQSRHHGSLDSE